MNRINQLFNSNKKRFTFHLFFVQVIQLWTVLPM